MNRDECWTKARELGHTPDGNEVDSQCTRCFGFIFQTPAKDVPDFVVPALATDWSCDDVYRRFTPESLKEPK